MPGADEEPVDHVLVGRIGPARGVHGDVFVEPHTDAPDLRFVPSAVLRCSGGAVDHVTVDFASTAGGKLVVRFADVTDRAAAESLRGLELFVPAAERPPIEDPDEFYDSDLIGLLAVRVDGAELGPVTSVSHAGAATHLVVEVNGRTCLVPFVREIVPTVDVARGTVTIDPPDGLLDL